jgi:hypothetical protein
MQAARENPSSALVGFTYLATVAALVCSYNPVADCTLDILRAGSLNTNTKKKKKNRSLSIFVLIMRIQMD